jgi:hypothetical protein
MFELWIVGPSVTRGPASGRVGQIIQVDASRIVEAEELRAGFEQCAPGHRVIAAALHAEQRFGTEKEGQRA